MVDARGPLLGFVLPREGEEVLDDAGGAARFGVNRLDRLPLVRRRALLGQQQLRERGDPGQRIVQLVGHPRHQLADRRHLLGLDELLLEQLLVGDVADQAQHLFVLLGARVGDLDGPRLAVFADKPGLEEPRFARERHLEMRQRFRQVVVGNHRGEPLADQLVATVARDALGRVVHGREPAVGVQGHDGVGGGLEQVAVAGLRAGEGLLCPLLIGDVPDRGDGAHQLSLHRERRVRNGHVAELAGARHHGRLVALRLASERLLLPARHMLALSRGDDLVHGEMGQLIQRPPQQFRRRLIGGEDVTVQAGDHDGVGKVGDQLRGDADQVERRTPSLTARGDARARRGRRPPLAHGR